MTGYVVERLVTSMRETDGESGVRGGAEDDYRRAADGVDGKARGAGRSPDGEGCVEDGGEGIKIRAVRDQDGEVHGED